MTPRRGNIRQPGATPRVLVGASSPGNWSSPRDKRNGIIAPGIYEAYCTPCPGIYGT